MSRNNTIGIVATITEPVKMVADADDWKKRVYETMITRTRPSGAADTFILRFPASAAGTSAMLAQITENTEVLIGGEIRTENIKYPHPSENRVKIYIYAEMIAVNDPPAKSQNEVKIFGFICKQPWIRTIRRRYQNGRPMDAASTIIAVNTPSGTSYIPCVSFGYAALYMGTLDVGDRVEIYGRIQSRSFKKWLPGYDVPYSCTAYEVCAAKVKSIPRKTKKTGSRQEGTEA